MNVLMSRRQCKRRERMRNFITRRELQLPKDIECFRLEPFIDLSTYRIIGYEVLSKLSGGLNAERWFSEISGRQQIDILHHQLYNISSKINTSCFYNLTIEGFINLEYSDIEYIASFPNVSIEISNASQIYFLGEKASSLLFKKIEALRSLNIKIWVDDCLFEDIMFFKAYRDKIDGIKIDKHEAQSVHLLNMINLLKNSFGNLPILIEGVESENILNLVLTSGANLAQGYYWNHHNLIVKLT
ncbi:EAL domain-containing protein [Escherichia coli]|nr:EAL domain-containing protein [Escherichia coli]